MTSVKYLLLLLLSTAAFAQAVDPLSVDPVLGELDAAGKNLKSFTADVKLSETDPDTGDATTRAGKVWYDGGDGNPRIHVQFQTRDANGKSQPDKIDYVLVGPDLIDRNTRNKTQSVHHVLQPGEKVDLFKLGQGPFPLPIGQSKEDVHAAFDVKRIAPAAGDPPKTEHLQLVPKEGTRLARDFKSIDVWVDPQTGMPTRIDTADQRSNLQRSTELTNVQVNQPVKDSDFTLPKIDPNDWQMLEDQYQR